MSVTVVTRYEAKSGKGMALLAAMSKPLELIRSKADCRSAEVFISAEITEKVLLLEEWGSAEAYEQCVGELDGEPLAEVKELLEASPTTAHYGPVED
jgi:quinol monooxygenase YgiN